VIFSEGDHIEQIKAGTKTQTRRTSDRYEIGKLYAVQPCRTCKGIPDGKILITAKDVEYKSENPIWGHILKWQAEAEGGYTPEEYEKLYESMHPGWEKRHVYLFEYFTTEELELMEKDPDEGFALYHSRVSQQSGTIESKGERTL